MRKQKAYLAFKYTMDRIVAFFGIILCLPLFAVISLLIAVDSRGKVIFKQEREGKNRELFYVYKFRTMKRTDVAFDKNRPVIGDDNVNVTRIGKILRKSKLDELPQLFNVLRGEMSFVGPRPLLSVYSKMYERWEYYKFSGRPGMTGLAQVNGNGSLSVRGRSYYDVVYNEKVSLLLDIKILCKTVLTVLFGEKRYLNEPAEEEITAIQKKYDV
ncbi:MAG: sugar transferase [Clostridia bacterium]|nr:sugar transferase [Clostridia bacterium]